MSILFCPYFYIFIQNFNNILHNYSKIRQLPTSNFQLPTSNFQLPTSNFQLQTSNFKLPTFSHIHTPHQPQSTNHNRNVQCAHNLPLFCPLKLHKPCGHSSFPAESQNYHQELQQHALHPEACLQIPVQLDQFR